MQHRNSACLCRSICYATALLLSGLIISSATVASELCQLPNSDTDNDGWGWENGASCIVDSSLLREPPPVCEQPDSDPDNDGWGWENDASCIIETTGNSGPATDIAAAATVAIGETLSASVNDNEPVHWYAFDIVDTDYAFTLTTSEATREQYYSARLQDSDGNEQAYWSIGFDSSEDLVCLTPGRYFFSLLWNGFPDEVTTYEIALNRTELRCASAEYTFETSGTDAFTTTPDGYAYMRPDNTLVAVSSTGLQLWTVDMDTDYVDAIDAVGNALYVSNSQRIYAFSTDGDRLWTYPDNERNVFLQKVIPTDYAVYVALGSALVALDLNGREQWLLPTRSGVQDVDVGTDGTLYLQGYGSVSVIRR